MKKALYVLERPLHSTSEKLRNPFSWAATDQPVRSTCCNKQHAHDPHPSPRRVCHNVRTSHAHLILHHEALALLELLVHVPESFAGSFLLPALVEAVPHTVSHHLSTLARHLGHVSKAVVACTGRSTVRLRSSRRAKLTHDGYPRSEVVGHLLPRAHFGLDYLGASTDLDWHRHWRKFQS